MPITSESQRNQVALLIALNVLFLVGYAVFILTYLAMPSPILIAVLIVGLGFNLAELWLSAPHEPQRKSTPKDRPTQRAEARELATGQVPFARTTAGAGAPRTQRDRSSLAERLAAFNEASARIDPVLVPAPETESAAPTGGSGQQTMPEPGSAEEPDVESVGGLAEMEAVSAEPVEPDSVLWTDQAQTAPPTERVATEMARTPVEEPPHSADSALSVDFVEAEIEAPGPITDVSSLADIVEAVEAGAEADATMDALAELGMTAISADAGRTAVQQEPVVERLMSAVNAPMAGTTAPGTVESEAQAMDVDVEGIVEIPVTGSPMPALPEPTLMDAEAAESAQVLDVALDALPVSELIPTVEPAASTVGSGEVMASGIAVTSGVEGLAADLMGDLEVTSAPAESGHTVGHPVMHGVEKPAREERTQDERPTVTPGGESRDALPNVAENTILERTPAEKIYLGGRVLEPVDIVIATLKSEPARKSSAAVRRRASVGSPSVRVPPRAGAGLLASSETLAMLRNQLGVGQPAGSEPTTAGRKARPGMAEGAKATAKVEEQSQDIRREARTAGRAGRGTAAESHDTARDRVMFVWHGRHFLAPMEGRHPLRVAQSLYDFMVEESMERG